MLSIGAVAFKRPIDKPPTFPVVEGLGVPVVRPADPALGVPVPGVVVVFPKELVPLVLAEGVAVVRLGIEVAPLEEVAPGVVVVDILPVGLFHFNEVHGIATRQVVPVEF